MVRGTPWRYALRKEQFGAIDSGYPGTDAYRMAGRRKLLVLTRKSNQSIMIGDDIEVSVLSIMGEKVRIGIQAPRDIPVFRREVYLEIQQENVAAGASARAEVDDALKRLSANRT
jgi:carbon storage regulator